jgi:hypothetical protein
MDVMSPNGAGAGEGGSPLTEQSVWQARWLLIPIFALCGGVMLVGCFSASGTAARKLLATVRQGHQSDGFRAVTINQTPLRKLAAYGECAEK